MKKYYIFNKLGSYHSGLKDSSKVRLLSNIFIPIFFLIVIFFTLELIGDLPSFGYQEQALHTVVYATFFSFSRLLAAYAMAIVVGVPLALITERNKILKKLLLPLYDIAQSIPILIFFPFIALIFIKFNFAEGAAIFILFMAMLWKIVFSVIFGINSLPGEIKHTAKMYHISGFNYIKKILLPAVIPQLTTGSILAFADGWNFVIVAEVMHTFVNSNVINQDLFGVGSLLIHSANDQSSTVFIYSLIVIVAIVVTLNVTVWQKLLKYAERYKF